MIQLLLKYKLEIIITLSLIANVVLTRIILSDSNPLKDNNAMIYKLEQSNVALMQENDILKGRIYKRQSRIDSLRTEIANQEPNIIYINKKVDEIPDTNITDSVLIILQQSILARDSN